jgi:hypothetical protein
MGTQLKVLLATFALGLLATPALAQNSAPMTTDDALTGYESAAHQSFQGIPTDWTSRHVIFSKPEPGSDAEDRVQQDPRYWMQQIRRGQPLDSDAVAALTAEIASQQANKNKNKNKKKKKKQNPLVGDWSEAMISTTITNPTYPAEFTKGTTASCANDFVVYALNTTANFDIIGFNNLYGTHGAGTTAFCTTGTVPTAIFAYNASTGGAGSTGINGSPVLSLDGTQIAFVESVSNGATSKAIFHVLKWHSGDLSATFPNPFNASALPTCPNAGACEYSLQYNTTATGHTAAQVSPYVDLGTDTAYVDDDAGEVFAIHPVFGGGTPALVTPSSSCTANVTPFACCTGAGAGCYPVATGLASVTSPVWDATTGHLFLASTTTGAENFATTSGHPLGIGTAVTTLGNVTEGPVLDSSTSKVFLFGNDTGAGNSAVIQTTTALGSLVEASLGGNAAVAIRPGAFDTTYLNGTITNGHLYVCGQHVSGTRLEKIGFTNAGGTMSAAEADSINMASAAGTACSSLTENLNTTTNIDWLFGSVVNNCGVTVTECTGNHAPFECCTGAGAGATCPAANTAACLESFVLPQTAAGLPATGVTAQSIPETGGTTGIVIDNQTDVSGTVLTSDIYFLTLGSPGTCSRPFGTGGTLTGICAVSVAQGNLQ